METTTATPTTGFMSSEFLATAISTIAMLWGALAGMLPPATAGTIAAIGIAIYTICRTALKAAHALGLANKLPDLPVIMAEQKAQGGYAHTLLLAIMAIAVLICTACVTPRTPAQTVYELENSYTAALTLAVQYKKLPACTTPSTVVLCSKPEIVTKLQNADEVAFTSLDAAKNVVTTPGMGANATTAINVANQAIQAYVSIAATLGVKQ